MTRIGLMVFDCDIYVSCI